MRWTREPPPHALGGLTAAAGSRRDRSRLRGYRIRHKCLSHPRLL